MFNIDKEGSALGFEFSSSSSDSLLKDKNNFNFSVKDYYIKTSTISSNNN